VFVPQTVQNTGTKSRSATIWFTLIFYLHTRQDAPFLLAAAISSFIVGAVAVSDSIIIDRVLIAPRGLLYSDFLAGILVAILGFHSIKAHLKSAL
jgi:hypothetical protein